MWTMGLWYEHVSLMRTMCLWYEHGSLMRTMGLWYEPWVYDTNMGLWWEPWVSDMNMGLWCEPWVYDMNHGSMMPTMGLTMVSDANHGQCFRSTKVFMWIRIQDPKNVHMDPDFRPLIFYSDPEQRGVKIKEDNLYQQIFQNDIKTPFKISKHKVLQKDP